MSQRDASKKTFLRVDVKGNSEPLWLRLRPKLINAINAVLDTVVDPDNESTMRDEAKQFTSALLDHAKAKLKRAGLENDRIEAEIRQLYSQIEMDLAESRKRNAEANALEFDTTVRKLRFALMGTKTLLISDESNESIAFGQEVDGFLESLKQLGD
jgi:DNA primase large subunit